MTPFQRISPLADCGNAFGRNAEPYEVQFVNTDLLIALHRDPVGEWMGSRSTSAWQPTGNGLADALLFDDEGPVGRALQTLLLRPVAVMAALPSDAPRRHRRADHVLDDPDVTASFARDWTGRFVGEALLVVRPGSTDEVAGALQACAAAGVPVVPQGGNTGLVGGSVPRGEPMVVLSTSRLTARDAVDAGASQVTLGAGVTIAEWRRHAQAAGFDAPVDFASRDSATVGGAVATNAGGSRVVRFGTMRSQVAGRHRGARRRVVRSARSPGCPRRRSACTGRRCSPAARARSVSSRRSA